MFAKTILTLFLFAREVTRKKILPDRYFITRFTAKTAIMTINISNLIGIIYVYFFIYVSDANIFKNLFLGYIFQLTFLANCF